MLRRSARPCGLTLSDRTPERARSPRRGRASALFATTLLILCCASGAGIRAAAADSIATVTLTPGWVTFGQAVPKGAAPSGLQIGSLTTQTDVKTRWSDGSIRFAVVSALVPANGSYAVVSGPRALGSFAPLLPAASVTLAVNGVAYVATLPNAVAADLWLSGPVVYEGRTVVRPMSTPGGAEHPFLRVNFDTRTYSDGTARVDVSVENVLNKPSATTVTYDATITVNGAATFHNAGVKHYYMTRWRKMTTVGAGTLASFTPDFAPFHATHAIPPYLPLVSGEVDTIAGPTYDIMGSGALMQYMPEHGGRPELAPYPDWTARYIVHRNPAQLAYVLANGDLAGSWPVHVREPEEGGANPIDPAAAPLLGVGPERLLSIDQRPTMWLDDRSPDGTEIAGVPLDYIQGGPLPLHEYAELPDNLPADSPISHLVPDTAHQPSLAFVPYLLTGDRYYAEESAMWSNYSMLRTYPGDGVRSNTGVLENGEVRGYGWALRNMADTAAYYPDSTAVKAYLTEKVIKNLQWLDAYVDAQAPADNPLQILWTNYRSELGYISLWEQTYLAHAIDRANKHGLTGGTRHRDAIARLQLRLFTSDPDYPREYPLGTPWGAPYLVNAGTEGVCVDDGGASFPCWEHIQFHKNMAAVWTGTGLGPFAADIQRPYAGYYGPEARLNLMIGVENAQAAPGPGNVWNGAQGAYDYLLPFIATEPTGCPLGDDRPDLACRSGWALAFDPGTGVEPIPAGDTTAPTLTLPGDISIPATSASGAQVIYTASAADNVDPVVVATCTPVSGSTFAIGTTTVACRATDAAGNTATGSFKVLVHNNPPTFTPPAAISTFATSAAGKVVTFTASGADIEDGSIAAICLPASNSTFAIATTTVTCTVTDSRGAAVTGSFTVTVKNNPPTLTVPANKTVDAISSAGAVVTFTATGTDVEDGAINPVCAPASGATFPIGVNTVHCTLTDSGGLSATPKAFTVTVTAPPPVATGIVPPGNQANTEGDEVSLQIGLASSPSSLASKRGDRDQSWRRGVFSATGLPPGLHIGRHGLIHGRVADKSARRYVVLVSFVPRQGAPAATSFTWDIAHRNHRPSLSEVDSQPAKEGAAVRLAVTASDEDGDKLVFSATGLPPGLTMSSGGVIAGNVGAAAAGDYLVRVTVSDGKLADSASFTWKVLKGNRAPKLGSIDGQSHTEGAAVSLVLRASDPDGDPLTFVVNGLPNGLRVSSGGTISGSLGATSAGTYDVTVIVSDGRLSDTDTFTWKVAKKGKSGK